MEAKPGTPAVSLPLYAIDTHALYWHFSLARPMPERVKSVFAQAQAGQAQLVVSHLVLAELF